MKNKNKKKKREEEGGEGCFSRGGDGGSPKHLLNIIFLKVLS
jgi:hypothetical protein